MTPKLQASLQDVRRLLHLVRESMRHAGSQEPVEPVPLAFVPEGSNPSGTKKNPELRELINSMTPEEHAEVREALKKDNIQWPYNRSVDWAARIRTDKAVATTPLIPTQVKP